MPNFKNLNRAGGCLHYVLAKKKLELKEKLHPKLYATQNVNINDGDDVNNDNNSIDDNINNKKKRKRLNVMK